MEDQSNKKTNKKKIIMIVVAFIILITVIVIILLLKQKNTKEIINAQSAQEEIELGEKNRLQEERENTFKQFVASYMADGLTLYDLKFKENTSQIIAGIYQGTTTEMQYNWDKQGIDEQTYKLLEIHNKESLKTMKVLYGPPYSMVEKTIFRVDDIISSTKEDYSSLETAVVNTCWEGFKYNWKGQEFISYIKSTINEKIDSLTRTYKIEFTPTEEQMNELIQQYYQKNIYGEKFNEFLINKGWISKEDLVKKESEIEENNTILEEKDNNSNNNEVINRKDDNDKDKDDNIYSSDHNSYEEKNNHNSNTNISADTEEKITEPENKKILFDVYIKNIWDKYCTENNYTANLHPATNAVTWKVYIDGTRKFQGAESVKAEKIGYSHFEVYGNGKREIKVELNGIIMYTQTINIDELSNGQRIQIGK